MPGPVAARASHAGGASHAADTAIAQVSAGRVEGPARGQVQPGLAGDASAAQLTAEGDRVAAVVVGVDRLEQDGGTGRVRHRRGQDGGPVRGGAGVILPVRPAGAEKAARQFPPVQAVGERHVAGLETPPPHGTWCRPGGCRRDERGQQVLALNRDREPVHHLVGHPDRRPGRDRQGQAVSGTHDDIPGGRRPC
jgi:hypothetical protein